MGDFISLFPWVDWFRLLFVFVFNPLLFSGNVSLKILPHNFNHKFVAFLIHFFIFLFLFSFLFFFSFLKNMIFSKFVSKPVNFRHLLYYNLSSSSHIILIFFTLSHSQPPISPLPLPCLGWSWSSLKIIDINGSWTVLVILLYPMCIFLYFDMCTVCKMIWSQFYMKDRTSW